MSAKTITVKGWGNLQPGDKIIELTHSNSGAPAWTVERTGPDPFEVGTPGTATVRGIEGVRGTWANFGAEGMYFAHHDIESTGDLSSPVALVTDFVADADLDDLGGWLVAETSREPITRANVVEQTIAEITELRAELDLYRQVSRGQIVDAAHEALREFLNTGKSLNGASQAVSDAVLTLLKGGQS